MSSAAHGEGHQLMASPQLLSARPPSVCLENLNHKAPALMSPETALHLFQDVLLFVLIITAAFTDIAYGKVYNWLTVPAILLGLGLSIVGWRTVAGVDPANHVFGFALGGGLFLIFLARGWVGPGDVKLVAAIGAIKGLGFVIYTVFLSACVGAVMALGWFIWRGRLVEGLSGSLLLLVSPKRFKERYTEPTASIPYGLAIAIGGLWAWFHLMGNA